VNDTCGPGPLLLKFYDGSRHFEEKSQELSLATRAHLILVGLFRS
jgi:hypothetical protein